MVLLLSFKNSAENFEGRDTSEYRVVTCGLPQNNVCSKTGKSIRTDFYCGSHRNIEYYNSNDVITKLRAKWITTLKNEHGKTRKKNRPDKEEETVEDKRRP